MDKINNPKLPLVFPEDIPKKYFDLFKICNSKQHWLFKQTFYLFKTWLLKQYGQPDEYDLQKITVYCHSCDGTGHHFTGSKCWNCTKGVYEIKDIILKRYILNGEVFHEPVGRTYNGKIPGGDYPIIRNTIKGLVKHDQPKMSAEYSFLVLLWHFDKKQWFNLVQRYNSMYQTRAKHKLKTFIRSCKGSFMAGYAKYLGIKPKDYHFIDDDLPF